MITLALLGLLLLPFLIVGGGMALFTGISRHLIVRWAAIIYLCSAVILLFGIGPYLAAWTIVHSGTRPPDRNLKDTPRRFGIPYEDIVFSAQDGLKLSGWFVPPAGRNAILIGTHGLFRNRVELLDRTVPVMRAGYGVLLYDTRSHGSSEKGLISLGYHERNDVLGATSYIHRRYQDAAEAPKVILMGVSMGAAATLEAAVETSDYAALILDSPFSDIRNTVARHCWLLLRLPRHPFSSLFLFWFERLADFDPDRVNSHKAIVRATPVPLMIIASEGDVRMGTADARALRDESRSTLKVLKVFGKEVGHGSAGRIYPEPYGSLIVGFLSGALGSTGGKEGKDAAFTASSAGEGFPR